jgi:pimeloyl-ACP methyl ester carboxylesterase
VSGLLFLHGVGGGHEAWDAQVTHFSGLGYRCLAWDQPGYGGRPAVEPYSLEAVTDALKQDLPEDAVLVGHSMGGMIAQEAYARFPERIRALVLCCTTPAFAGGTEFARQFIAARIGPLDRGETMAQVAAQLMPTMQGKRSVPGALEAATRVMAGIPPATYRKAVALLTTFDRRAHLARIAVPTLLVAGSDDRTAPAAIMQKMAQRIPGAQYAVLEGCGHLGPLDQPGPFNAVLEEFLRRNRL